MSKIRIHAADDLVWRTVRELSGGALDQVLDPIELDSPVTFHERGDAETIQLQEAKYLPHAVVAVHAHGADEIMYIAAGRMHFGDRVLEPGSSIFVAGGGYYGFKAGDEGVRVLTFRPRADPVFRLKATEADG